MHNWSTFEVVDTTTLAFIMKFYLPTVVKKQCFIMFFLPSASVKSQKNVALDTRKKYFLLRFSQIRIDN